MSPHDVFNYALFSNPVSSSIWGGLLSTANKMGIHKKAVTSDAVKKLVGPSVLLSRLIGNNIYIIRLAGLSGAIAVTLAAYGAHKIRPDGKDENELIRKQMFETANLFHFVHTITLLGVPMTRHPALVCALMSTGMCLFSGINYYSAVTGDFKYKKLVPIGGTVLIFAWLSMML